MKPIKVKLPTIDTLFKKFGSIDFRQYRNGAEYKFSRSSIDAADLDKEVDLHFDLQYGLFLGVEHFPLHGIELNCFHFLRVGWFRLMGGSEQHGTNSALQTSFQIGQPRMIVNLHFSSDWVNDFRWGRMGIGLIFVHG